MHKIIITDAPDSRRVSVGHNGKLIELPVNEEVEVTDGTLDALTASSIGYVLVDEGGGSGVLAEPSPTPRKNMTTFNDVTRTRGLKAATRDLGGNPDKTDVPADEATTGANSELAGTVAEPKSKRHPLDHDGDGKKGGSKPKAQRKPATKKETKK